VRVESIDDMGTKRAVHAWLWRLWRLPGFRQPLPTSLYSFTRRVGCIWGSPSHTCQEIDFFAVRHCWCVSWAALTSMSGGAMQLADRQQQRTKSVVVPIINEGWWVITSTFQCVQKFRTVSGLSTLCFVEVI